MTVGTPAVVLHRPVAVRQVAGIVWPAYRRVGYQAPTRWDPDGDRIPNWHDRLYNPRWDIDGDGVPNRRDRQDDRYRWSR